MKLKEFTLLEYWTSVMKFYIYVLGIAGVDGTT